MISRPIDRRAFLLTASVAGLRAAEPQPQTFTYKNIRGLDIKADVYRGGAPVAVWIHGGALINGGRQSVPTPLKDQLIAAGFTVVSIDYRLAPETKLRGIIADLIDAFAWIRSDGPKLFGADPERIVVLGSSAGGYLTLTAGFRAGPRPKALVSFWGYGDLIGSWYSSPSPHERHHRIKMSRQEALAEVSGPPIANSRDRGGNGGAFYQHCRQHGIWPLEVSGWNPHRELVEFHPYMPLVNVTPSYPPTLLIHGTADTDVPFEQSELMAAELSRNRVEHEFLRFEGAEHGLARDAQALERAYSAAVEFVRSHA